MSDLYLTLKSFSWTIILLPPGCPVRAIKTYFTYASSPAMHSPVSAASTITSALQQTTFAAIEDDEDDDDDDDGIIPPDAMREALGSNSVQIVRLGVVRIE